MWPLEPALQDWTERVQRPAAKGGGGEVLRPMDGRWRPSPPAARPPAPHAAGRSPSAFRRAVHSYTLASTHASNSQGGVPARAHAAEKPTER